MFEIGIILLLIISVYLIHHVYDLIGWERFKKDILIPSLIIIWVALVVGLMAGAIAP